MSVAVYVTWTWTGMHCAWLLFSTGPVLSTLTLVKAARVPFIATWLARIPFSKTAFDGAASAVPPRQTPATTINAKWDLRIMTPLCGRWTYPVVGRCRTRTSRRV